MTRRGLFAVVAAAFAGIRLKEVSGPHDAAVISFSDGACLSVEELCAAYMGPAVACIADSISRDIEKWQRHPVLVRFDPARLPA